MKLKFFKRSAPSTSTFGSILSYVPFTTYTNYNTSNSMKLSTVYRCVNLLSDSVASLPIFPYYFNQNWKYIDENSTLYNLLNVQPNPFQSSYEFKKQIVVHLLLSGSAYVKINRDKNANVTSLVLQNPNAILLQYNKDNTDIQYLDTITGSVIDRIDMVHILNQTIDGIRGLSTISYAANTLGFANNIDTNARNFFSNGSNVNGIISPEVGVQINDKIAQDIKNKFIAATNVDATSGGLVVLGGQFKYTPISISPKDAQLIESKKLTELDIARFFSVPPSLIFADGSTKFATAEQEQINFLNSSLTALLEKIESELFRKLYLPAEWNTHELKFDLTNLFRADATTQAAYYTQLYNLGALSTNEIREKINAKYPVTGGNQHFVQVNLQPIDNLYANQKPAIDNKVK